MEELKARVERLEARVNALAEMVERVTINNANMLRAQQGLLDLQQDQSQALKIIREELARLSKTQDR